MKKNVSFLLIVSFILIIFTSILFAEEIKFTFQNEPDGFRGLKWGDPPTEDMYFSHQILNEYLDKGDIYYKINDKKYIGSVELYKIQYTFNLRSNQFYKVEANFSDEINYNILRIIFEDKFGEPTYTNKGKDSYLLSWRGDKTFIRIWYNPKKSFTGKGFGQLTIESVKIRQEDLPEINKQKEVEKAKEDF